MPPTTGHIFWVFGLSGAGKSKVAAALIAALRDRQVPVLALDGDILRERLCRNLYRWSEVREYCGHLLKESS